jgi:hypothetical protein
VIQMRSWSRIDQRERPARSGVGNYNFIPEQRSFEVLDSVNARRTRMGLRPFRTLGGLL